MHHALCKHAYAAILPAAGAEAPEQLRVALGQVIRKLKQHWQLGLLLMPLLSMRAARPLGVELPEDSSGSGSSNGSSMPDDAEEAQQQRWAAAVVKCTAVVEQHEAAAQRGSHHHCQVQCALCTADVVSMCCCKAPVTCHSMHWEHVMLAPTWQCSGNAASVCATACSSCWWSWLR